MCAMKNELEKCPWRSPAARAAFATCVLLLTGFAQSSLAQPLNQTTFGSPQEAYRALVAAIQKHDERAVREILGGGDELVSSDDATQDARDRERFVRKYQEMHRLVRDSAGVLALYVGAENWPFPIPLVARDGVWRFDSDAGANEIRFRRIGENEMTAIATCHALAASKMRSGADGSDPLGGYYFRVLSKSGTGLVAIAYPAQ